MARSLLLALFLVPATIAYGPCPRPYSYGPQPACCGGGCRGGYSSPWRGYGVQYPPQQAVRYVQTPYVGGGNPYAGQYQVPHQGGSYATPPPSVVIPVAPAIVHPTQSTPIDHSTSIAAAQTTTDELADIFDEFKGRDEEELLTGGGAAGRLRSDTSSNSNLFLQPLQPPGGRATPYKPELAASHDESLSTSQITKDLISDSANADSKTGFIPQSKPLPASFTQTFSEKDPFLESAGMGKSAASPVSPTLSPSRAQTMVVPASAGTYAVAPGPVVLPQPTSQYVRPYPFGPHNVPQRPYVSPYGGYRPVVAPQPLQPCAPVSTGQALGPYPAGPYPSAPPPHQPQPIPGPVYTRIGGGAVPHGGGYAQQGGYVVAPPVSPALPQPFIPRGGLPPFVDCCGKCRSPCRSRVKRQFAAKLFDAEGKQFDVPPTKDGRCTSEELRETMMKSTTSTPTLSKRLIQKAAEEQFGGFFSVFCSKEDFSYTSRSAFYCQTSKNDVVCFAFRHN